MILDKIIKDKEREIQKNKLALPLKEIKPKLKKSKKSFRKAISKPVALIAEIKQKSPSKGIINKKFNFNEILKVYNKNRHVKAISVLTDKKYFGGSLKNLKKASISKKPVLRKDFIIDPYQVYEARYYGADAILLIAGLLAKTQMDDLIKTAKKYNMDCLVEVHNKAELDKALKTKADIIGINNRNLNTLKIDLNITLKLAKQIKNKIIVSESGICAKEDIRQIKNRVNAVLIGTSMIKSKDINKKIDELIA